MKFSFCLIAKNEIRTLHKLMASLQPFLDAGGEVCLLDTGSTDGTADAARRLGCKVEEAGSRYLFTVSEEDVKQINEKFVIEGEAPIVKVGDTYFDFAGARNHAAMMAVNDMVSFVDADEVLTTLDFDKINQAIDEGKEQFEYNFVFAHDQFGNPAVEFVQSKFYNRYKAKWVGLVHEYLDGNCNIGFLPNDVFRLEHYQEPHSRHSYLVGLAVDCFNNPSKDRNSHYLAREMFWSGRPQSAITEFQRHLTLGGWFSERAESLIFMGDAYGQLNKPEDQALSYSLSFYIDSGRREALMKLAEFYLWNKNYQAAICYVHAAMQIPWSGFYASQKGYYEHIPHEILYKAYGWLGDMPNAQKHILEAIKLRPQNPDYQKDLQYYFGTDRYQDKNIEGWMTPPDLQWLYEQGKKYDTFIEVGSWAGRSSHAILTGNKGTVWCVDTWKGSKEEYDLTNPMAKERDMLEVFKKNVGHFPNLNIVQKPSIEAAKDFADKSVDIVFIDAGHTYEEVLEDIDAWLPKAKKILCGHDYLPDTWMGVVKAVNEKFGKPDGVVDWIWWIDLEKRGI